MTATVRWTLDQDYGLRRNGRPALLLGGQVHNSSTSTPSAVAASFDSARAAHANTVIAPVSWALVEPVEGTHDFALVNTVLDEARRRDLRVVLLWFGAFKNAASTYAPRWVRSDAARFPRAVVRSGELPAFTYRGAMPKPVLSTFSAELRTADAAAFAALARHLDQVDPDGTVAMLQVENEVGLLGDSRDRCEAALAAWSEPVPAPLLAHVADADPATSMAARLWRERGSAVSGRWTEVFGEGDDADEVFMAWSFASYVEHVAAAGRRELDRPLYANAWLGPQPGQDRPGQYPSGGPTSRVIDVWHAAAPTLALVAPDIYVDDADAAMRVYAGADQPFFVPECRLNVVELVRAIGGYRAIGWSAFGIDDADPGGLVSQTLAYLTALEEPFAAARADGRLGAIVLDPGAEALTLRLGDLGVVGRDSVALLEQMLLDAGVRLPASSPDLPDETSPGAVIGSAADPRAFCLLALEEDDTLLAVGRNVTLDVEIEGHEVEIDAVEDLVLGDAGPVVAHVVNGDERLRLLPVERVGAARIRLLRR